jgi:malate dehydrogenase (oxaloacetate-decarboxylating)
MAPSLHARRRGAPDVTAKTTTEEMCIVAAYELALCQEDSGLDEEHIMPTMEAIEPFIREAVAVGMKAQEQGVARMKVTEAALRKQATAMIAESRKVVDVLMREDLIHLPIH